jgi:hypothetical protein
VARAGDVLHYFIPGSAPPPEPSCSQRAPLAIIVSLGEATWCAISSGIAVEMARRMPR